jgi:uncharacterized OB-fold protein
MTSGQGYIAPQVDSDGAPFWEAASLGQLVMQACGACGKFRFPPRPMCPHCRSTERVWKRMSGFGTIWSFVFPHAPLRPEFDGLDGFNVVVVALDEDPQIRLVGNLVSKPGAAINSVDRETIRIGDRVSAVFAEVEPGVRLLRWMVHEALASGTD